MKKTILVMCMLVMVSFPAFGADSKEIVGLKRDASQERVLRIQTELELLKTRFREGQIALQTEAKLLEDYTAKLKALETPAKETESKKKDKGK